MPDDTFVSSGASVKASLLFLQKFTEKNQAQFNSIKKATAAEIEAKYASQITAETERRQAEIDAATKEGDSKRRQTAQRELADYLKQMQEHKAIEARALLKERFDYPVFMYEAEKVGITATGEPDQNELYPNERQLPGTQGKTCLELYREFRKNPETFALEGEGDS